MHNLKNCKMYADTCVIHVHPKQLLYYRAYVPFVIWGGIRGACMTGEPQPRNCLQSHIVFSFRTLLELLLTYSECGMYSQVTPGLLNTCDEFASNQLYISKQKFESNFLYLVSLEDQFIATEDSIVHLDTFWISAV